MIRWLTRLVSRPRAAWGIVLVAVALQAPSLPTGFVADDWLHLLIVGGHSPFVGQATSPLDLFSFASGDPARALAMMRDGLYPWTVDPEARLAFLRPLSSLTHVVDHLIAPGRAWFAHLQNLLWFALGLGALAAVYRRWFAAAGVPLAGAGLALLLYAVDDARSPTVSWVANRNALVALALALPVLALHDRWRRDGDRLAAWLAPACLALALAAGESSLAVLAYLVAYALCLERGDARLLARARTLLPYAGVVLVWIVVYRTLGYGARYSGIYFDPAGEPVAFLRALPWRLPHLLVGQLALPWSELGELYGLLGVQWIMLAYALAVLAALAWLMLPLLRRSPLARAFALGMLLAALPVCATFTADRLLSFVGVGGMGLLALLFTDERARSWPAKLGVGALVVVHVVLAPPLAVLRARGNETVSQPFLRADATLPSTTGTVVALNLPADVIGAYVQPLRAARGEPVAAHLWWLFAGTTPVEVVRDDARTLRLRPQGGFIANVAEHMLRSRARPFHLGERVDLGELVIEVTALTPDGRPAEAVFRFARPLEDAGYHWCSWRDDEGCVAMAPPPVGGRVRIAGTDFLRAMLPPPGGGAAQRK